MSSPSIQTEPENRTVSPEREAVPEANAEPSYKRRRIVIAAVVVLVIGTVAFGAWRLMRGPDVPTSIVALSGRIDGDDSAVASKTTGRILRVNFREGDAVHLGDEIAVLDDEQVRAREHAAQAVVDQSEARVQSARLQTAVLGQQKAQSLLQASQSQEDAAGRVKQAESDLAAARADLAQQQANLQLATFDRDAYTRLAQKGAVSERQGKEAASKADAQQAAVNASQERVDAAMGALTLAKSSLTNFGIRNAQTTALNRQIEQQNAEVASAESQLNQSRSQLAEAQANRNDLVVRAPFDGVIVTRTAEPGEVTTAGTSIVTMLDLHKVYLRGFVPEGDIGRVKLGQPARVYLDSASKTALSAIVIRIDPQATFTPENTYFRNDRVKQVVGVKLQMQEGFGAAKPGMPADGEILVEGDRWPSRSARR